MKTKKRRGVLTEYAKGTWAKPRSFSGTYGVPNVLIHLEKTVFSVDATAREHAEQA